jgi:hypothetical protein
VSDLLPRAFAALGMGPTDRELALVADTLADAGAGPELEAAAADRGVFEALVEVASAAGSSGFVALDLVTHATSGSRGVRSGGLRFNTFNDERDTG